jgi:type I restriction enzyme R subunit
MKPTPIAPDYTNFLAEVKGLIQTARLQAAPDAIGVFYAVNWNTKLTESGFSNPLFGGKGGRECPPSVDGSFFNPHGEIDKTSHHLPHWQQGEAWVFVTWRLGDSLPKAKLDQWKHEREAWMMHHPKPWDEKTEAEYHERYSRQIDEWLDQGSGSCVLQDPANARIVADALRHFDGKRYGLASFVVMPNHVHVLFRPLGAHTLPEIVKSWKGFTAREINKRIGKKGALWQDEYWDRLIRNERHFFKVAEYIRENPMKAMLREGQFILESGLSKESGLSSPLPPTNGGLENPPSVLVTMSSSTNCCTFPCRTQASSGRCSCGRNSGA